MNKEAYREGVRNGHADRLLAYRNDYSWYSSCDTANEYMSAYSSGYNDGWIGTVNP